MVVESCKCGSAKRRPYRTTRFALPPLEVVSLADARIACLARASTHRNPVLEPSSAARGGAALSFPTLNQGSHARGVRASTPPLGIPGILLVDRPGVCHCRTSH